MVGLQAQLDDLGALVQLGQGRGDQASLTEAADVLASLQKAVETEVRTLLSGVRRARGACHNPLPVGGVDAADFAAMLLRMYLRWAATQPRWRDTSYAEKASSPPHSR